MHLKRSDIRQVIKFGIVGFVGFGVNYAFLSLVDKTIVSHLLSEALAALVALQFTFILHNIWTYKTNDDLRLSLLARYGSYLVSNSTGTAITIVIYSLLSLHFGRLLSLAIAAGISMFWNFFMNRLVIWRHSTQKNLTSQEGIE